MKSVIRALLWSVASLSVAASAASPAPNYFVANCFNCHGTDGRSSGAIPPLAGLDKAYIIQQIAAFKAGTRQTTVMHQLAKGYTDEEIARAADYFAAQKR
jgi:cytochrome c553